VANLGERPEPYFITEIADRDGRVTERAFPRTERVVSAPVAYLLLHVLRGVIETGTGNSARAIEANLAGKTGTTDDYSDAWFVGFTPRVTVGVWVGRDRKEPIGKRMTGARAAQPIWNAFVRGYLDTLNEPERAEDFPVPAGVVFTPVDWYTGERAVPRCPGQERIVLEAFLDGTEPTDGCVEREYVLHELPWPFQLPYYAPRPGEPMPTAEAVEVADDRITGDDRNTEEGEVVNAG
jgi:penicillin-binding protein 1A